MDKNNLQSKAAGFLRQVLRKNVQAQTPGAEPTTPVEPAQPAPTDANKS